MSTSGSGLGDASIAAVDPDTNGYATEFQITLGSTSVVVQGDQIIVAKSAVVNAAATSASNDLIYVLPDITPPTTVPTPNAEALPVDVDGLGYSVGDTLELILSEPIQISYISETSVSVISGNSFGSSPDHTVTVPKAVNDYVSSVLITLGGSPSIVLNDTVSLIASDVLDAAGNSPDTNLIYTIPAASTVVVQDISIDARLYESGDEIKVRVQFSADVTVSLGGSTITIELNIGGSVVRAEIDTSTSTGNIVEFSYSASGVIDTDGIEVVGNSLSLGTGSSITASSGTVNETFPSYSFTLVTVNAPF